MLQAERKSATWHVLHWLETIEQAVVSTSTRLPSWGQQAARRPQTQPPVSTGRLRRPWPLGVMQATMAASPVCESMHMFRIKICGLTTILDAQLAVEAGADAIGLNFYEQSPRSVTTAQAGHIAANIPSSTIRVGVFVNRMLEDLLELASGREACIDAVQFHGDEPAADVGRFSAAPVIRARRMDEYGLDAVAADLRACRAAGRGPDAILVDAATAGSYGGSGVTLAWDKLTGHRQQLAGTPLILAGGLNPDNVAEAIHTAQPFGVDVASGVESAPGVKDPVKVRDFIQAASQALAAV